MKAVGRLLRLSLTASALADIAAGLVLGAGGWPFGARISGLFLGSLLVYHGGMALNDWADRAEDAELRPDRPLPSGALPPALALALGLGGLFVGPLLAAWVAPRAGLLLAGVALAAGLYDVAGRGPWRGPMLLGLCRAGNLGAGIVAGRAALESAAPSSPGSTGALVALALGYGLYVFALSRLGRLEDDEEALARDPRRPRRLVLAIAALLSWPFAVACLRFLGAATPASWELAGIVLAGVLGLGASQGLVRAALAKGDAFTRSDVLGCMGLALRRLLIFTSASAAGSGSVAGIVVALIILLGYPVSFLLRRVFPPS